MCCCRDVLGRWWAAPGFPQTWKLVFGHSHISVREMVHFENLSLRVTIQCFIIWYCSYKELYHVDFEFGQTVSPSRALLFQHVLDHCALGNVQCNRFYLFSRLPKICSLLQSSLCALESVLLTSRLAHLLWNALSAEKCCSQCFCFGFFNQCPSS